MPTDSHEGGGGLVLLGGALGQPTMAHAVALLAGILAFGSSSVGAAAPHKHGP